MTSIPRLGLAVILGCGISAHAGMTLEQALKEGLASGPDAQLARNSLDSAKEYERSVRSAAYPTVSASASAGLGHEASSLSGIFSAFSALNAVDTSALGRSRAAMINAMTPNDDPYYSYSVGLKVTQTLYSGGKVSTALHMASTYDKVNKASNAARQQTIQQNVADAWFSALLAQAQLEVTEKSVARQAEVLKTLERNFAMGSGQKAQVLQARTRLIQTKQSIVTARANAIASRKALNRLLSRPADDTSALDTAGLSRFESDVPRDHEALVQDALRNRQDLRAMQESRSILHDATFIKKATYYPNVGLQGAVGLSTASQNASGIKNLVDWDSRTWSVGVGLSWTIYDGGSGSGEEGASRAAERAMDVNIATMQRAIDINADSYLREKEAADSGMVAAREGVDAAREAYSLYQSNFRAGSGQLSDVLSSEDDLRSAELGLLSARLNVTKACIHLSLVQGKNLVEVQ